MTVPLISPMPPVATGVGLPWDAPIDDPVSALAGARRSFGDTFVVDSGEDRYLFTFSPSGVACFYGLPEDRASKGIADWRMLRRKLPDEMFVGRRVLPQQLFGRENVTNYLDNVELAVEATIDELGSAGEIDVFAMARRLGHRVGLASWGGPGSAGGERFDRLVQAFDTLDGAESFVHPDAMSLVAASGKAAEHGALGVIIEELGESRKELPGTEEQHPLFARVVAAWSDQQAAEATIGTSLDLALIHVASMSNLFAALGWHLIDLIGHPAERARVRSGDMRLAEACALESIRMAQRSIMSRYVVKPVELDVGSAVHAVPPGVTVATLLPLTNGSAAPGLDVWDPDHWNRRRLAEGSKLAAVELVTAFGHGRHSCPAQPFSLSAMTLASTRLLAEYEFDPGWGERPYPVVAQIGGVARSALPCHVRYCRCRDRSSP
jgi:cytochrome P450